MKNVTVTINPTEIKSLSYNNNFSIKPGEKIALNVKSEAAIKPNASNPVTALVGIKMIVTDSEGSLQLMVETITGVTVSTFIDDLEGFIRANYTSVVVLSSNEKMRAATCSLGIPVRLPNPTFGPAPEKPEGMPQ